MSCSSTLELPCFQCFGKDRSLLLLAICLHFLKFTFCKQKEQKKEGKYHTEFKKIMVTVWKIFDEINNSSVRPLNKFSCVKNST